MRKISFVLGLFTIFFMMTGCHDVKKKNLMMTDTVETDTILENDTTLYGRCGDGTAMHTLELITGEGDTLMLSFGDDSISPVKGGLAVGDRMAVIMEKDAEDGSEKATQVINLTTLMGKWAALDKSFELQDGGVVVSKVTEPHPLTEWKIFNGHLVLSADTFDIYELGSDSLLLENRDGIFAYKRMK